MLREEFSGAGFRLWKNSTFCHSERSEESLFPLVESKPKRDSSLRSE